MGNRKQRDEYLAENAKRNDAFRKAVLIRPQTNGRCNLTRSVAALEKDALERVKEAISSFSEFNTDNDPHREHDFGAVEVDGVPKVFWKIDYCEDETMQFGETEGPENAFRVMTIMFADEY